VTVIDESATPEDSENGLTPARSDSVSGPAVSIVEPQTFDALLEVSAGPGDLPPIATGQVVTSGREDVILIGRSPGNAATVDILTDAGLITRRDLSSTATPVTDPDQRERLLRLTLSRLADRYRNAVDAQQRQARASDDVLSEVRRYAIAWFKEEEEISRESLDAFLAEFDLSPYRPTVRVEYTITGSYVVIDSTTDEARDDAADYLRPDLSQIDRVDEDSDGYTVSVASVDDTGD
jgi:hypothetical protein